MNSPRESNDGIPASPGVPTISRRQRLFGIAKATRDTYIPKITGSVSHLATGVSNRAFGGGGDMYDEEGNLIFPQETTIQLFRSYTREKDGKYYVDVKGWLSCPGTMTRKNRLILSLAKQVTKYGSNSATSSNAINQLESENFKQDLLPSRASSADLESLNSDSSSIASASRNEAQSGHLVRPLTNSSISSNVSNSDDIIKERLACFIAKSIPNTELSITVGSASRRNYAKIPQVSVVTDIYGHFETTIEVDYFPSIVHVSTTNDEKICAFEEIMLIPNDGLGVISDIDDTVKLTGVIGDKRELMCNLLLNNVTSWSIPQIIKWYGDIYSRSSCSFHYVSNSPWQLYTTILEYLNAVGLPKGSIHLKQYTGNIISSIMEPSTSKKQKILDRVVREFPDKKFICIGDSGEHDLEAYSDLARKHPTQITSIYIRFVEDSLSDVDDQVILQALKRIIKTRKKKHPVRAMTAQDNLIDLSEPNSFAAQRSSKLPPMVPKKPANLKGRQVERKPPLPSRDKIERSHTDSEVVVDTHMSESQSQDLRSTLTSNEFKNEDDDTTLHRSANDEKILESLQHLYNTHNYSQLEDTDRKGALWLERINIVLDVLEGTDTELILFEDQDTEFFQQSLEKVNQLKEMNVL